MNAIRKLRQLGQGLWLDGLSREMLLDGRLQRYLTNYPLTGLRVDAATLEQAFFATNCYDEAIDAKGRRGLSGEALLLELLVEDLTAAAELLAPLHRSSSPGEGWISAGISPLLAHDADATIAAASELHARAGIPRLMIEVPGTAEGIAAVEVLIFAGVPVHVTQLFSREQYLAAAEAYARGIARRRRVGLSAGVASMASLSISPWDASVRHRVPPELRNRLGIALAMQTYAAYCRRWRAAFRRRHGDLPHQWLSWAGTGREDPRAAPTLYGEALVAPHTIDILPEETLTALGVYGQLSQCLPQDGGEAERLISRFEAHGIEVGTLARDLQRSKTAALQEDWRSLLGYIEGRTAAAPAIERASPTRPASRSKSKLQSAGVVSLAASRRPGA